MPLFSHRELSKVSTTSIVKTNQLISFTMRTIAYLSAVCIVLTSCLSEDAKFVNNALGDMKGTWKVTEFKELKFPNSPPNSISPKFPSIQTVTFEACDYIKSGNKCFGSIKLQNKPLFRVQYHISSQAKALTFIYPSTIQLSKEDSLLLSKSWWLNRTKLDQMVVEQANSYPYYSITYTKEL